LFIPIAGVGKTLCGSGQQGNGKNNLQKISIHTALLNEGSVKSSSTIFFTHGGTS
jgi:hypothetical protein